MAKLVGSRERRHESVSNVFSLEGDARALWAMTWASRSDPYQKTAIPRRIWATSDVAPSIACRIDLTIDPGKLIWSGHLDGILYTPGTVALAARVTALEQLWNGLLDSQTDAGELVRRLGGRVIPDHSGIGISPPTVILPGNSLRVTLTPEANFPKMDITIYIDVVTSVDIL